MIVMHYAQASRSERMEMSNNVQDIADPYKDSVMTWGNQTPWKKLGVRLSHKVRFLPEDVVRDGKGNILSMPTLPKKPCFGRPEVIFRHGKRTQKRKLRNGRIVDSESHQCGTCPAGVREACIRTAFERVKSDPNMDKAFSAWRDDCRAHYNGEYICTGLASLSWVAFKKAIAQRGPFDSPNDAAVAEQERQERDAKREKWKDQKRLQRFRQHQLAQQARQLPSQQFVSNLIEERDIRLDALLEVLGQSGQPPARAKVPADKREATAVITANAWAVRTLLKAAGRDAGPGRVASLMTKHNLAAGVPASTLKARMKNDLKRVAGCEQDGLWKPFDPDSDLKNYETMDDDAADELGDPANEIDQILKQMAEM